MNAKDINKIRGFNQQLDNLSRKWERVHALGGLQPEDFLQAAATLFTKNRIAWLADKPELNGILRKSFVSKFNGVMQMDRSALVNQMFVK